MVCGNFFEVQEVVLGDFVFSRVGKSVGGRRKIPAASFLDLRWVGPFV